MVDLMQKIISLAKRRGFIFQSSEIYGGVEALWDYGPLGALLKNNIRRLWLKRFIQDQEDVVLIDGTVIMHPKTWEASGHLESFTDPLIECKTCHTRYREDQLLKKQCSQCGGKDFTPPRQFNLMFKTFLGPVEDKAHLAYLRPETAQSMFTDFKTVQEAMRLKPPFGIAQTGHCFRNEITTGNFTFRSREFDIAEIEFFVEPGQDEKWFDFWLNQWEKFFFDLGLKKENLRRYEHPKKSLAHYSKRTVDIEYKFPWGFAELAGVANRTDYDLKRHAQFSGRDLSYYDEEKKKKYYPYVIEPTMGLERALLAILCDAYTEVKGGRTETTKSTKETEVILKIDKKIAPIQVAVLPLVRNKPELVKKAKEVFQLLKPHFMCQYDDVGSIGRRYRRGDEVGTIVSIACDFQTLEDNTVTLRDRDSMKQIRVEIPKLKDIIQKILEGEDFFKLGEIIK
ncbi:MAG: glycine--tRNA ligase [Candidatus Nealsonbacteria bacterium CG_4_10_14_0_2_um_filter_39_15]|uniref:Glycine--tRNA ligase n=5 Tax=Candidatus Nealsoniibacteriota TaxID=1817911 RepID=A0A2M7UWD6_9BACT|nr:MAG: glycine--tRNA ligase [Candidatus Nealsonbacteria bacterium CG_4_10_14_0_2_um_filter_39_15]